MSPIAKKIAAVAAVCAIAALSAQAESPVAAENGIRLSEWGNSPVLPEVESSASARKAEAESVLPELGEFLSEEWQTLGAGATDTDRLRKALANRATGRADDSLMSFMTSRWESAPGRLANFLTDHAETRLNAMPGIENAALDLTPARDGNGFGFSASGVGMLHRDADSGFGLQPKIERSSEDGKLFGSFGAFQRKALGDWGVVGVNVFADYANDPVRGDASRFRVGADFSSAWVDADLRRIIGGEGERYRDSSGRLFQAYAPHGTEAELRVHSPNLLWLEGFAKFAEWEGRGGNADTRTDSFGLTFHPYTGPMAGLRADAGVSGENAEVDLAYSWMIGKGAALPKSAERFNVYTEIAKKVAASDFNFADHDVYEGLHLYELEQNGQGGMTPAQLAEAYKQMWALLPSYLQVGEVTQGYCPPPVFNANEEVRNVYSERQEQFGRRAQIDARCVSYLGGGDLERGLWGFYYIYAPWLKPVWGRFAPSSIEWTVEPSFRVQNLLAVDMMKIQILAGVDVTDVVVVQNPQINWVSDFDGNPPSPGTAFTLLDLALVNFGGYWNHRNDTDYRTDEWVEYTEQYTDLFRLLSAGGARCSVEASSHSALSDLCIQISNEFGIAEDDKLAVVRKEPPKGSLPEIESPRRIPKLRGPVFTITANTDYRDVDYALVDDSGLFEITNNGDFTDHTGANGEWRLRINTLSEDPENPGEMIYRSKQGVISAKNDLTATGRYIVTIVANFFYHTHTQDPVNRVLTIDVVEGPDDVVFYTDGTENQLFRFDIMAFLPGVELSVKRIDSKLRHISDEGFQINGELDLGVSAEAELEASGGNLVEALSFKFIVKNPDLNDKEYVLRRHDLECDRNMDPADSTQVDKNLKDAVERGDLSDACQAIIQGANVDHGDGTTSMLNRSILNRDVEMQRLLIAYDASKDLEDDDNGRPIHTAAKQAEVPIGSYLLRNGVDAAAPKKLDLFTPLHFLAQRQRGIKGNTFDFADLLKGYEISVNKPANDGLAYMHIVAKVGNPDSMPPILGLEPKPHLETRTNLRMPLHLAAQFGNHDVMRQMLIRARDLGLKVDKREVNTGKAAIHYATTEEVVDHLICAGSSFDLAVDSSTDDDGDMITAATLLKLRHLDYLITDWEDYTDGEASFIQRCNIKAPGVYEGRPSPSGGDDDSLMVAES